ncbi:MAG: thioredoxin family protein [Desulfitobacteriaceae bacterium]
MDDKSTDKKRLSWFQVGIIGLVLVIVAGIFVYKNVITASPNPGTVSQQTSNDKNLPRLVDLGAGTCIPCKQMAPILEELKNEYEGRLIVDVIDVYESPKEANKYGIRVIPTQILFDADGDAVWGHEGFIPKEDLIKAFEQVGVK